MPTTVIMQTSRPDGAGGTYKQGSTYTIADDLAAYFLSIGAAKRTSTRSEQTGATISGNAAGQFPSAPALSRQVPVTASITSSGGIASSKVRPEIVLGSEKIPLLRPQIIQSADVMWDSTSGAVPTITPGSGCTINAQGFEVHPMTGDVCYAVTATASSAGVAYFDFFPPTLANPVYADGWAIEMCIENASNAVWSTFGNWLGSNTSLTKNLQGSFQAPSASTTMWPMGSAMSSYSWFGSQFSSGTVTAPQQQDFSTCRIRGTLQANATGKIYFRRITTSLRSKARHVETWDDGYSSVMDAARLANRYGIRISVGVIWPRIGTPGFLTERQLFELRDMGHELVIHGPNFNMNGNWFDANYPTDALTLSDILYGRDALVSKGLADARAAATLIWPQGRSVRAVGDTTVHRMLFSEGFEIGRGITKNYQKWWRAELIGENNPARLCLNVNGHNWAGSTAAEVTNINGILADIDAMVAGRADQWGERHKVVPTSTADGSMTSLMIRMSDLDAIYSKLFDYIKAGQLESCVPSDLI